MPRPARYILKPPGAYSALRDLTRQHDLRMIDKVERESGNPIALQEVFGNAERTVGMHYIEDGLLEIPYLKFAGPDADKYAALIAGQLPVYSEAEIFEAWDQADALEDKIDAMFRLAITADDEPTPPYLERIRNGMLDAEPEVRSAALTAFSYHPWSVLRPLVERIRDTDVDEDARARAEVILETWDRLPPTA